MTQAESIRSATAAYFAATPLAQPGQPLLQSLHCPYLDSDLDVCFDLEHLDPEALAQLRESLLAILRLPTRADGWSMANAALLAGLAYYVPWRDFAAVESDAYTVAATIVYFLDDHLPRSPLSKIYVTGLLNEWLHPANPWLILPDVVTVCRHMFGDVWCDLTLAGVVVGRSGRILRTDGPLDICRVVEMDRPPFLTGLCLEQDSLRDMRLPEMDSAP